MLLQGGMHFGQFTIEGGVLMERDDTGVTRKMKTLVTSSLLHFANQS